MKEVNCDEVEPRRDRRMSGGGPRVKNELRAMVEAKGGEHGTMKSPGHVVQERAFGETL